MKLLTGLLLLFAGNLYADAGFDSLWRNSNFVVYGQVVRHEVYQVKFDSGAHRCKADILIYSICDGGTPVRDMRSFPKPADTISNVDYLSQDDSDTLMINASYYVFPLTYDSSRWRLTHDYSRNGVFRGHERMNVHCPIIYFAGDTTDARPIRVETSAQNGWKTVRVFNSDGTIKRIEKSKWVREKRFSRHIEYDDHGHVTRKSRTKTTHGNHHVTWTFRKNGKPCLHRRSIWILD
jgi:hypothetical protein